MVLHGDAAFPQVLESVPSWGLTTTEVIAAATAHGNVDKMQKKERIDTHRIPAWN